jgi:formimidoylglutamate deiminase
VINGLPGDASSLPTHIHVAEQVREVEDCVAWSGARPVQWLLANMPVGENWCAIHATHMSAEESTGLATSGAVAGLCPTTEANLGDGIFPAPAFLAAGGAIAIGSDSHISVCPADDLRWLEYSQRLRDRARNVLAPGPGLSTGRGLLERALAGGARALGRPLGAIAPGHRGDFVVLDQRHPSLLGRSGDSLIDSWIFSAGKAAVRHVFVSGKRIIHEGRHRHEEEILSRFEATLHRLQS